MYVTISGQGLLAPPLAFLQGCNGHLEACFRPAEAGENSWHSLEIMEPSWRLPQQRWWVGCSVSPIYSPKNHQQHHIWKTPLLHSQAVMKHFPLLWLSNCKRHRPQGMSIPSSDHYSIPWSRGCLLAQCQSQIHVCCKIIGCVPQHSFRTCSTWKASHTIRSWMGIRRYGTRFCSHRYRPVQEGHDRYNGLSVCRLQRNSSQAHGLFTKSKFKQLKYSDCRDLHTV